MALSVVVRIVGGCEFLERCLAALVRQINGRPIEVIVPHDSTVTGIDQCRVKFPGVQFVDMGTVATEAPLGSGGVEHELYDRRTARGFAVARGQIVAQVEDQVVPDPDWCEQVLEAHRLPCEVIGGAVLHQGTSVLNWSVYFMDFWRYAWPLSEGPAKYLTDVNLSYKRTALEGVREAWDNRYNEVIVHWALARKGAVLWQRPSIVVRHDRGQVSFSRLLRERFWWGRLFAHMRTREMSLRSRFLYGLASPGIPIVMLFRMVCKALRDGDNGRRFLQALPQITTLTFCWGWGECVGYVTGKSS